MKTAKKWVRVAMLSAGIGVAFIACGSADDGEFSGDQPSGANEPVVPSDAAGDVESAIAEFPVGSSTSPLLEGATQWTVHELAAGQLRIVARDVDGNARAIFATELAAGASPEEPFFSIKSLYPTEAAASTLADRVSGDTFEESESAKAAMETLVTDLQRASAAVESGSGTIPYGWLGCTGLYLAAAAACGGGGILCTTGIGCLVGGTACVAAGVTWLCECTDLEDTSAC